MNAPKQTPRVIPPKRWSRNARLVEARFGKTLADGLNHALAFKRKNFIAKSLPIHDLSATLPGSATTQSLWHGRFHAGVGARKVSWRVGMAKALDAAAVDPYVDIQITRVSAGSTVTTAKVHYSAIDTGATDSPEEFHYGKIDYVLPADNEAYEWVLRAHDYARPFCIGGFELSGNPVVDDALDPVGVGSPIYDEWHQQAAEICTDLMELNSAHLIAWTRSTPTAPSYSSGSFVNILDGASTSYSAATPGWTLDLEHHQTVEQDTVPCILAVRGEVTGADWEARVRLTDGTNTVESELIDDVREWRTEIVTLPAATAKWDAQIILDSGTSVELDAVSLYILG